jgi:hypothetical protein
LNWITKSGLVALISDNVAVEAMRDCREFRAGLGMIGAKEPDDAATQRTSYP